MNSLIQVPFHGSTLYVVEHNGEPYTPLRPIVEGMGLVWGAQASKIRSNRARWGVSILDTPSTSGIQKTNCLPLRKLAGWLMSVHPSKVNPEIRGKITTYQNECDDALWNYWNKGQAENPRLLVSGQRADTVTLAKDEYIELLKAQIIRLESGKATPQATPAFTPRNEPHTWMNPEEISEILRLHAKGERANKIAKKIGRPVGTVSRTIKKLGGERKQ